MTTDDHGMKVEAVTCEIVGNRLRLSLGRLGVTYTFTLDHAAASDVSQVLRYYFKFLNDEDTKALGPKPEGYKDD